MRACIDAEPERRARAACRELLSYLHGTPLFTYPPPSPSSPRHLTSMATEAVRGGLSDRALQAHSPASGHVGCGAGGLAQPPTFLPGRRVATTGEGADRQAEPRHPAPTGAACGSGPAPGPGRFASQGLRGTRRGRGNAAAAASAREPEGTWNRPIPSHVNLAGKLEIRKVCCGFKT